MCSLRLQNYAIFSKFCHIIEAASHSIDIFYLPPRRRPGTGDFETPCLSRLVFALELENALLYFLESLQVHHVMGMWCIAFDIDGMLFEFFMNFWNIEKCPLTYWLNGRWFLQIVDREF